MGLAHVEREMKLQHWMGIIKECNERPNGVRVEDWIRERGISKDQYYYWLRRVKDKCLKEAGKEPPSTMVRIPQAITEAARVSDGSISVFIDGIEVRISSNTSSELIKSVIRVIRNA